MVLDPTPALRVRLVLQSDGELPELPHAFSCDLRKGELDVGEAQGTRCFTKDNREIVMEVAAAGRLRVCWHLERVFESGDRRGVMGGDVLGEHELDIEVQETPGEQVFTLALDGAALTELTRQPPW